MEPTKFYEELIRRYLNNQASAGELEVLFHLIRNGDIDDLIKSNLEIDARYFEQGVEASLIQKQASAIAGEGNLYSASETAIVTLNKPAKKGFPLFKIAALLLLAVGISLLFYARKPVIQNWLYPEKYLSVNVVNGRVRQLYLADGTEVWLNAGSTLKYPEKFNGGKRELYLDGEAFFKVHHDAQRPFIIHSKYLHTTVLGTSFNVRSYPGEISQVTVSTGMVSVAENESTAPSSAKAKSHSVMLTAAQQVSYNGARMSVKNNVNVSEYLGWKSGDLVFTGRSLLEMKAVLERWYDVKINIKNQKLMNCSMIGSYHQETLKNILEAMRFSLNITYKIDGKQVYISGGKCI